MRAEWEVREAEHKTEIQRLRDASQALQDQLTVLDQQRDDMRASLDRRQHDHDLATQSDDLIARDKQQLQQKSELLRAKDVELKNLEDRKLKLEQAHKKKHAAQRVQLETTVHAQVKSHQEEIERTHRHFQRLLDIKDDEMSNLSYRLKTVTATRQKDINKLQVKQHQKQQSLQEYRQRLMQSLENQTKAYQTVETKHQGLETKYLHGQRQWKQLQQERKQIQDQLLSFQRNNLQLVESIQQLQTDVRSTKV
ncbi:hypothetical protein BC940DRAFT_75713 [Gongronella butleri]|nr:hypothetical protein BC940DRAFT_75713 [Gongronella butleri]